MNIFANKYNIAPVAIRTMIEREVSVVYTSDAAGNLHSRSTCGRHTIYKK